MGGDQQQKEQPLLGMTIPLDMVAAPKFAWVYWQCLPQASALI